MDIRALDASDDLDALLDLSSRAFGPRAPAQLPGWYAEARSVIADRRWLGVLDGPRLIAAARYHVMRQCWHGRWQPMAGVASVMVAPEDRGRGTGRALMTAMLELIASRGYQISVLYPATSAIYRSVGWEIAGVQNQVRFPARSVRALTGPDPVLTSPGEAPSAARSSAARSSAARSSAARSSAAGSGGAGVRRCRPGDTAAVLAVLSDAHQALRDSGPATRDQETVQGWLADRDRYCYLAADGFLSYRWRNGNDEIEVDRLVAVSAATTRALWGIVASHSSIADTVLACVGPADPVGWLTREPDVQPASQYQWMLRVVDAPGAIAERGFPAGAEVTAALELADPARPGNEGRWTLEVSGGKAALTQGGTAPVGGAPLIAGPRGFAALYAGTPVATLRRAGLASGGTAATDAALDTAFAASPFLHDYF
jgi:predicted acetyltransferase